MIHHDVITTDTTLYIERESGFELGEGKDLQQGSIYYININHTYPQPKRVVGEPEPVFDTRDKHIIEDRKSVV